jgi:hypothetical protein
MLKECVSRPVEPGDHARLCSLGWAGGTAVEGHAPRCARGGPEHAGRPGLQAACAPRGARAGMPSPDLLRLAPPLRPAHTRETPRRNEDERMFISWGSGAAPPFCPGRRQRQQPQLRASPPPSPPRRGPGGGRQRQLVLLRRLRQPRPVCRRHWPDMPPGPFHLPFSPSPTPSLPSAAWWYYSPMCRRWQTLLPRLLYLRGGAPPTNRARRPRQQPAAAHNNPAAANGAREQN